MTEKCDIFITYQRRESKKGELTQRASTGKLIFVLGISVRTEALTSYPERSKNFGVPQSRSLDMFHNPA